MSMQSNVFDAVVFGEVMMRLSPPNRAKLSNATITSLERSAAGAELNVAAGLSQLGVSTALITKLPDNDISRFVLSQAMSAGVNTDYVIYDNSPAARLGVYYFEGAAAPRKPTVVYDRKNSSICSISADEVNIPKHNLFHVSGITLALGGKPREVAIQQIKALKSQNVLISFDVNYRANLWSEDEARQTIEQIFPYVDILFISEETMRRMFGKTGTLHSMMKEFASQSQSQYPLKYVASTERKVISPTNHNFTATIYHVPSQTFVTDQPYSIEIVDRIGSGDAFVAGALYGILKDDSPTTALQYGMAMAAAKCTIAGDLSVTSLREIEKLIASHANTDSSIVQSEMDR